MAGRPAQSTLAASQRLSLVAWGPVADRACLTTGALRSCPRSLSPTDHVPDSPLVKVPFAKTEAAQRQPLADKAN